MKIKAIGLLSGGLDSTLAVKVIMDQGIDVIALNFKSPFCACTGKNAGCKSEAVKVAKKFDIQIRTVFQGKEYLQMIANPKYGYGKNLNPCLDCRIMMFLKAKEVMEEERASFVFTGEVLGQRPMSQRRDSMRVIERDSGLEGIILRPLSAKFFPPTKAELNGTVNREKLLNMSGRSRKPQISLADSLGIHDYPCAAGGCLLTEAGFASKMRDLIVDKKAPEMKDVKLLRVGRHLRINSRRKIIVGRNEKENKVIETAAESNDTLVYVSNHTGPMVLVRGELSEEEVPIVASITVRYSSAPNDKENQVSIQKKSAAEPHFVLAQGINDEKLSEMRI